MIKADTESMTTCESCGKPAIRRSVYAMTPGVGGRYVTYDTHATSLDDPEHHAVLARIEKFHAGLHQLKAECGTVLRQWKAEWPRSIPLADIPALTKQILAKLVAPKIIEIDFDAVQPQACEFRTHIEPTFVLRSWGMEEGGKLEARELTGLTAEAVLIAVLTSDQVEAAWSRLKRRWKGDL